MSSLSLRSAEIQGKVPAWRNCSLVWLFYLSLLASYSYLCCIKMLYDDSTTKLCRCLSLDQSCVEWKNDNPMRKIFTRLCKKTVDLSFTVTYFISKVCLSYYFHHGIREIFLKTNQVWSTTYSSKFWIFLSMVFHLLSLIEDHKDIPNNISQDYSSKSFWVWTQMLAKSFRSL